MKSSLEGRPTKSKEASAHCKTDQLDTNPVFQCLGHNYQDDIKPLCTCSSELMLLEPYKVMVKQKVSDEGSM